MDDVTFIAKLFSNDLLPGELKNEFMSQRRPIDELNLFLHDVINPGVTMDGGSNFDKLLNVMEDSEYEHMQEMAKQIRTGATTYISIGVCI